VAPITNTKTGRFYKRGDVFTTGKSGITGTISEIGLRWAMVKIGA